MTDETELVRRLRDADETVLWTGPDGLFAQAAARIEALTAERDAARAAAGDFADALATLRAELATHAMQPLETAPEDEPVILATTGGWIGEAWMLRNEDTGVQEWTWAIGRRGDTYFNPLGWWKMPPHPDPTRDDARFPTPSEATTTRCTACNGTGRWGPITAGIDAAKAINAMSEQQRDAFRSTCGICKGTGRATPPEGELK